MAAGEHPVYYTKIVVTLYLIETVMKWEISVKPTQGVRTVNLEFIINIYCVVFLRKNLKKMKVGRLSYNSRLILFTLYSL